MADLIAAFAPVVDEESIVVSSDRERPVGARQPFVMELADGTAAMRGEVEVIASTPPPQCRVRLRFLALDRGGRDVHQGMLDRLAGRSPGQRKALPIVRIPDKEPAAGPAPILPARTAPDEIPAIPPLPPRLRKTTPMQADALVPPPPQTWEEPAAPDEPDQPDKATRRMFGLEPPPSQAPRVKIDAPARPSREDLATVRMEPLFAEEWPAEATHAVVDERPTYLEERDRETARVDELRRGRPPWIWLVAVVVLALVGVMIGLALS